MLRSLVLHAPAVAREDRAALPPECEYAKIMIKLKIMKIKVDTHLSSVNKHFFWHLSNASTENWGWKIICFTSGVSGAIAFKLF